MILCFVQHILPGVVEFRQENKMQLFEKIRNKWDRYREDQAIRRIFGPVEKISVKRCGNDYGGFDVAVDPMADAEGDRKRIVYSFGIGEDLSFSEAVDKAWDCEIYAFDPTPRAAEYVRRHPLSKKDSFHFFEWGIADQDGIGLFHLPKNEEYVSGSLHAHEDVKQESIEVPLRSLHSIAKELGHQKLDLLKLDVEGSEFDIMEGILESGLEIRQICLEVHNRYFEDGSLRLKKTVDSLRSDGYHLVSLDPKDLQEATFVLRL